jgi:hypothetical protein
MRHPIAVAFVVAVVTSLVLAAVVLSIYPAQQSPWALGAVVLAFPFIWFFAWVITNGFAWWRETSTGEEPPDGKKPPIRPKV